MDIGDLVLHALDESASSAAIKTLLASLSDSTIVLTRKDFSSISYRSSQAHGVSLQCSNQQKNDDETCKCKAVDIYNEGGVKGWSCFSRLPVEVAALLPSSSENAIESMASLHLTTSTTGIDLVKQLGEPHRKGGGEPMKGGGASGLGPGAWMEWNARYQGKAIQIMIEMAGQEARGRDRWEKEQAGKARWGVCTFALAEA
jgi:hypothetical protein